MNEESKTATGGDLDLDAIEQRERDATPGPWCVHPNGSSVWSGPQYDCDDSTQARVAATSQTEAGVKDADFIASARTDVRVLLDELRRVHEAAHLAQDGSNPTERKVCLPKWGDIDTERWIRGFAEQSYQDRLMSCVEDGSCMGMIVDTAVAAIDLNAELETVSKIATINGLASGVWHLKYEAMKKQRDEARATASAMLGAMDGVCPLCGGADYHHDELCSYPKAIHNQSETP